MSDDLSHYRHAQLYDKTFRTRTEDVRYFCDLAAQTSDAPVLEYGAGSGRVTIPLAKQGHHVVAVDASSEMLGQLKARLSKLPQELRGRVEPRRGDMRRLNLGRKFPLILATFNVVAHLPTFGDMRKFLSRARAHLEPGGQLVFDVPLPHPDELEADPEERFFVGRFKHPKTGEWLSQTERFEYDPKTQVLLVESAFRASGSADELTVPLYLRQWFPKELEALLLYEGFSEVRTEADYSHLPGAAAEETMIYLARR